MSSSEVRTVESRTGSREIRLTRQPDGDVHLCVEPCNGLPPYTVTDVLLSPEAARNLARHLEEATTE